MFAITNVLSLAPSQLERPVSHEINIYIEDCIYEKDNFFGFEMTGNLDLLVEKASFKGVINDEISRSFQETYPAFDTYEFLDQDGFISYFAFAANASVQTKHDNAGYMGKCSYMFGRFSLRDFGNFKLVYFEDDGSIIYQTDVIEMPSLNRYNVLEGDFMFNTTTRVVTSTLNTHTNRQVSNLLLVVFILAFFYVTVTISGRLLLSYLGHFKIRVTIRSVLLMVLLQLGYIPLIVFSYHNMFVTNTPLNLNPYYINILSYLLFDVLFSTLILKPKRLILYILSSILTALPFAYYLGTMISELVSDTLIR